MARQSKCSLVRKGEIKHIPRDWHDKQMPNCLGYEDSINDEPLTECKNCKWFWANWKDGKNEREEEFGVSVEELMEA